MQESYAATITIVRSAGTPSTAAATVGLRVEGTAERDVDFTFSAPTLYSFEPSTLSHTLVISTINNDVVDGVDRVVRLSLVNPTAAAPGTFVQGSPNVGHNGSIAVVIVDDGDGTTSLLSCIAS